MTSELTANSVLTGSKVLRGTRAVEHNAEAILQVYESIKTSYGPLGLDKMCVDASGSVSITNDGATILKNMLVEDSTARIMVNLALEQDKEVGDGTTTVVLLASNLIKFGAQLIKDGVHPSIVVSGYRIAFNECIKYVKNNIALSLPKDDGINSPDEVVDAIIATSISSKIINQERELFSGIIKRALQNVFSNGKYHLGDIKILKALGGSLKDSEFSDGFLLNCVPASKLMRTRIDSPKILCLEFSLNKEKFPLTVNLKITDPEKMEQIRREEIEITKQRCMAIIESGVNVVLTTGGIDEIYTKMFTDHGVVAVKRCTLGDLKILTEATGTAVYGSLLSMDNAYAIESLGSCDMYELKTVGDHSLVYFKGCRSSAASILLRGPNEQLLDEAERSLNDALQVVKRTLEHRSIVPGGGAVEAALAFLLEEFTEEVSCREHVAIYKFSQALLEIPRILAANAGLDADILIANLMKQQHSLFKSGERKSFLGINALTGGIQNNIQAGIVEPTIYKLKVLKSATEAAISVLRIDEIIVFPGNE